MNNVAKILGLASLVTVVACGSSSTSSQNTSTVQGALTGAANVAGLRVIAKTDTGKLIWTNVDTTGHFSLQVPKDQPYRILLSKVASSGANQIIGHLVIRTSKGKSLWLVPNGSLALGKIQKAGQAGSSGVKTMSGAEAEGAEAEDTEEASSHEEDEKDGSLCRGSAQGEQDDELEAENDPGDKCAKASKDGKDEDTDKDGKADKDDDEQDDIKSCGAQAADGGGASSTPL